MSLVPPDPPLKLLLVDDDRATLLATRRILEKAGYQVLVCDNGFEAMEAFEQQQPDMVLTDFQMPGMSGAELTRRVHARVAERLDAKDRYVPVLIFTSEQDPEFQEESLGSGAIQFMTKPIGPRMLLGGVKVLADLVRMHRESAVTKEMQAGEIALVKHQMEVMVKDGLRELPEDFRMHTLATRRINGDACSHRMSAPGVHYGCMVDAMGHGLVASVSAVAMLEVFHALGPLGHSTTWIYGEMNRKHLRRFPVGRFSCALLFRLDLHQGRLSVLNAGIPLALLRPRQGPMQEVSSESLPLGILLNGGCGSTRDLVVHPGDLFFACTDGLTELVTRAELEAVLSTHDAQEADDLLRVLVREHIGSGEQHDDVSWILWTIPEAPASTPLGESPLAHGPRALSLDLAFAPRELAYAELGPTLAKFLGNLGLPPAQSQSLGLVLAEGLCNAAEHGLMRLDSHLKQQSWEAWEAARTVALAQEEREIHLGLKLYRSDEGGAIDRVEARIQDPGPGFGWRQVLAADPGSSARPHGRGLLLIQALSRQITYNEEGNCLAFSIEGP